MFKSAVATGTTSQGWCQKIWKMLSVPGTEAVVDTFAPYCGPAPPTPLEDEKHVAAPPPPPPVRTAGRLDRYLDTLVPWSGSWPVFSVLVASIMVWALAGIKYGRNTDWQVFVSDYQALLTYFFDSLLMRQQFRQNADQLNLYAILQSRLVSNQRMVSALQSPPSSSATLVGMIADKEEIVPENNLAGQQAPITGHEVPVSGDAESGRSLPTESTMTKIMSTGSNVIGHISVVFGFCVGVVVWIGLGPWLSWSNAWQLYMNSATSALMVILFAWLALVREQHAAYTKNVMRAILDLDEDVERRLRLLTGDVEPNPEVRLVPAPVGILQRSINYYAGFISMLVGIMVLLLVVVIWVVLGPVMKYDSSWWLLIGTYAGLIGMNDGFVLRNIAEQLSDRTAAELDTIKRADRAVLAIAGRQKDDEPVTKRSLTARVSAAVDRICAHRYTTLMGLLLIFGLISAASALKWSVTGQLLCNVPPSIIETFFMIILITGHNAAAAEEKAGMVAVFESRSELLDWTQGKRLRLTA